MSVEKTQDLLARVDSSLRADPRLRIDELALQLSDDRKCLELEGRVADIGSKRLAANQAWQLAHEHCQVHDRLRVRADREGTREVRNELIETLGSESIFFDHRLTIESDGEHQIIRDPLDPVGRLNVSVDGGVVRLEGQVQSLTHRRFAEVLAWWAPGCDRVDNLLEVVPAEQDHDNEIADAVRMVLEKDPFVEATQLRVGTAGGIVELRGLASSEEQRQLAVRDAWYTPGVWDVVDRIEVRA